MWPDGYPRSAKNIRGHRPGSHAGGSRQIDAARREVVNAERRLELIAMLGEEGRFDFQVAEGAWGSGRVGGLRQVSPPPPSSRCDRAVDRGCLRPTRRRGHVALCPPLPSSWAIPPEPRRLSGVDRPTDLLRPGADDRCRPRASDRGAGRARSPKPASRLISGGALAEARRLVVLHYDADFELVAGITGQNHEWIVPRGTADRVVTDDLVRGTNRKPSSIEGRII